MCIEIEKVNRLREQRNDYRKLCDIYLSLSDLDRKTSRTKYDDLKYEMEIITKQNKELEKENNQLKTRAILQKKLPIELIKIIQTFIE